MLGGHGQGLKILVVDDRIVALGVFVAALDLFWLDDAVAHRAKLLIAHARSAYAVDLIKRQILLLRSRVQAHRDAHHSKRYNAAPNRSGHCLLLTGVRRLIR